MVGYIYLTTDTTNGKQYVGQHHYNKEGELDPSYHGSGIIISRIYKERPETLKEEYIKTCYSDSEMNSDEQYYIKFYDTLWPNGYNLTEGGEGCVASEETRKKISESLKGKTLSEEHRKKLSNSHKGLCVGEKHPMFGKKHSEESKRKISESKRNISDETRKKLSEAKKGKHLSDETKKKMSESHKGINIWMKGKHLSEETKKKMSESLKGRPSGMLGKKHSEETKKKLSESLTNGKLSKPVLQLSLDGEFIREWPSTAECGRNGFNKYMVAACCRGERKSHKGYIWRYK